MRLLYSRSIVEVQESTVGVYREVQGTTVRVQKRYRGAIGKHGENTGKVQGSIVEVQENTEEVQESTVR